MLGGGIVQLLRDALALLLAQRRQLPREVAQRLLRLPHVGEVLVGDDQPGVAVQLEARRADLKPAPLPVALDAVGYARRSALAAQDRLQPLADALPVLALPIPRAESQIVRADADAAERPRGASPIASSADANQERSHSAGVTFVPGSCRSRSHRW